MLSFSAFLAAEKGLGPVTVEGYVKMVRKFCRDIDAVYPVKEQVLEYILALHARRKSYSHIRNLSNGVEWLMKFWRDPIVLEKQKRPRRLIRAYLMEDEVKEIIAHCRTPREKAIVFTLAYSGMRLRELCSLKISDINHAERSILIRDGKGSQDRIVYVAQACLDILRQYTDSRLPDERIFRGQPGVIRRTVRRIVRRTSIRKRVYPHLFRHSLAMNMLTRGCNLLSIQQQLGHRHIETTLIYLHSTPEFLRLSYDKYCPQYADEV